MTLKIPKCKRAILGGKSNFRSTVHFRETERETEIERDRERERRREKERKKKKKENERDSEQNQIVMFKNKQSWG